MNLESDGFLSPDITEWAELNRKANKPLIDLVRALNRVAQRIIISLSVNDDNTQRFVSALIYVRGVTNCQAAIVLAEMGAILGSRILARSCFEDVFYLGAVKSSAEYYKNIIEADRISRGKIARALLNIPDDLSGLDHHHKSQLTEFLANQPDELGKRAATIAQVAKDAELTPIYDTFYRGLSNDSAHLSVVSLNRHLNEETSSFLWGPEPEQMVDTLSALCTALFYLVTGIRAHFNELECPELEALWAEYKRLLRTIEGSLR